MSFMLWYSTQGTRVSVHAIAFWSTHMVDFFFVSRFCFFSCGAGALSEWAVLSLDTPFSERRTVFLFPRLVNLDIV